MGNVKLIIEYEGTNYAGWQIQNSPQSAVHSPQKKTIQEVVEKTLQRILQEKIKVTASGRTDAGVHALAQAANFRTRSELSPAKIQNALNALLPDDISIKKTSQTSEDFHASYSARSKAYRYFILNSRCPSVFLGKFSWHLPYKLDLRLMQKEVKVLAGSHDFKSFCASGSGAKTTIRTIKKISIKTIRYTLSAIRYPLIVIDIEADGFLYNMMRNIVGTLVEIGRGRFEEGSLERILRAKDRTKAGPIAPAKGLFLAQVKY